MKQFLRFVVGIVGILVIVGSVYGVFNRQAILDFFALRNYNPPEQIVALADDTTMQDGTRRVFYVNHPELNDKTAFRQNCPTNEHSIVLGCYVERNGIYLLDVTDERLTGIIQVTAAHEVLHAEYDRLSSAERQRIDGLTAAFLATLTDDRVKKTVEEYRAKDPSVVPNELHSILATEVKDLSTELEQYYGQYFKDRSKIVAYSERYEQTFIDLKNQVEKFDEQLNQLKIEIESNKVAIEGQNKDLEQQKNRLDNLMNSGDTDGYNNEVPAFNGQVNAYNSLINQTRGLISQYNSIVEKRNAIATAEQELVEALDSKITSKEIQ